ncbi:hypothetical protein ASPZODRAFT_151690 [Penicilliopsis zonata CBS 506.65]|uniref:Succinate dehydrogenase assembly factor 4, mitochondrial n=1 Tax=Penicilliopsis zonata CBS 506.65 TaxID=1073090 RepID=A0A1L9SJ50_9EURO|nr:hypothetical protein ASPZODRAFT_151690 [Penicilliopsis zonata CBS 506.65]OJJ47141.1 hypothetical protein ASPZODRAFT_151690 [Penicilliopsis zonata CBS 506.65]
MSFALRRTLLSSPLFRSSRSLSTTSSLRNAADDKPSPFASAPAPPRLPKEEQEIFERLQRQSTGAFSTPNTEGAESSEDRLAAMRAQIQAKSQQGQGEDQTTITTPVGVTLKPEFEGEKNPRTGEVGGPKNEPLRWGAQGDWSYGGRVTDF